MTKIENQLQKIKESKKIGLMTHVIVGYPTVSETKKIVKIMAETGVDFVELQIPFSDPLADGPTIMQACEKSLENGTKVKDAFTLMTELSQEVEIPLLFMAYYNTVFRYGVEKFCEEAAIAGASGLIVPDMPIDEEDQEHFYEYCKKYNLHVIHVVSPASTDNRLRKNADLATGFVYATARQGTTGVKGQLDDSVTEYLHKLQTYFSIPVAVGFGISSKTQIDMLTGHVDIAVLGSALINVINNSEQDEVEKNVKSFLEGLR